MLEDQAATRPAIIRKLHELARAMKPDDSLVIYYAGHGHLDQATGVGSWIPVEAEPDDPAAWISNTVPRPHPQVYEPRCGRNRPDIQSITEEAKVVHFGMSSRGGG